MRYALVGGGVAAGLVVSLLVYRFAPPVVARLRAAWAALRGGTSKP